MIINTCEIIMNNHTCEIIVEKSINIMVFTLYLNNKYNYYDIYYLIIILYIYIYIIMIYNKNIKIRLWYNNYLGSHGLRTKIATCCRLFCGEKIICHLPGKHLCYEKKTMKLSDIVIIWWYETQIQSAMEVINY